MTALEAARKARDAARRDYEAILEDTAAFLGLEADDCRPDKIDIDEIKVFRDELANTKRGMRTLRQKVKRGASVASRHRIVASRRPRTRSSHARKPGHRRSTRSRDGPSDDSDSDGPGKAGHRTRRLALAPMPKLALTFACLTLDRDLWREINR